MVQWILAGAALIIAFVALARARSLGRRLERLTQNYWELRYQHASEIRADLQRLSRDRHHSATQVSSAATTGRPTHGRRRAIWLSAGAALVGVEGGGDDEREIACPAR